MKKEVVLVGLILIAIFALVSFSQAFNARSADDARKFFAEDLADSYPTADVREIQDVTKIGDGPAAYYVLTARVTYNLSTPCPERLQVEYNYPARNFVKRNDTIVYGCQVCQGRPHCVISYPEEAIIASHTYNGSADVSAYLAQYPLAKPSAGLLASYNGESNVWEVNWTDPSAPTALSAHLSEANNSIIDVLTLPQTPLAPAPAPAAPAPPNPGA
ncbi:MAG: hypothetical protein KGH63_00150 [Candidatus Micrarchaeota archaeon]|nr:hypothetical protein [Candidatus Micrarchaeota archaeon]